MIDHHEHEPKLLPDDPFRESERACNKTFQVLIAVNLHNRQCQGVQQMYNINSSNIVAYITNALSCSVRV